MPPPSAEPNARSNAGLVKPIISPISLMSLGVNLEFSELRAAVSLVNRLFVQDEYVGNPTNIFIKGCLFSLGASPLFSISSHFIISKPEYNVFNLLYKL